MDFRISTGLKNIIGRDLITEAHTAVFELVKNAYDARATRVDIVFQDIKTGDRPNRGKILIVDDGDGMSYEDIRGKWLFVGYSKKKLDAISDDFRDKVANKNRMMAGAKGIGRFSTDRLGTKLELYTRTRSDSVVHRVMMDWGRFEDNQDKEFQTIKVEYEAVSEFPSTVTRNLTHGTVLEIYQLSNDNWDKAQLLKLKKYLQRLVNPVQIPDGEKFEIHLVAEEFLESDEKLGKKKKNDKINGKVQNFVFEKLEIKTTQITCNVAGSKITTQITDKGRFVFKTEEVNNDWKRLLDININVFYLNPEAKKAFTRETGMRSIQFGSIFLYRNGFRIHPYGEEKDDWLKLEQRKGQGYSRYLSTREMLGRIEINRKQNGFSEVSSRHGGVVETEEYRQLVEFMKKRVIRWLERYVVEGLDWDRSEEKVRKSPESIKESSISVLAKFTDQIKDPNKRITFNEDLMDILEEKRVGNIPEIVKNLGTLASFAESESDKARIKRDLALLADAVNTQYNAAAAAMMALKAKEKEILLLKNSKNQKLAEDYNHWIVLSTDRIRVLLRALMDEIPANKGEKMMDLVESISKESQRIAAASSVVSQANFDVQLEKTTADLVAYIVQYVDEVVPKWAARPLFSSYNTNFTYVTKFSPLEIAMLLDNLASNAERAHAENAVIRFLIKSNALHMLFGDDGKGISDTNKDIVFKRGFTTTAGSGIGLSHVRDMARRMGGDVRFLGNGVSGLASGACFEVIFNADG